MAAHYPPELGLALNNINRVSWVTPRTDADSEWFHLKPKLNTNWNLFRELQRNWSKILPPASRPRFALIFCHFGPNAGVWLHYLGTPQLRAENAAKCEEIYYW